MGAALAFPSVPGTIAGFAAAGFGVATLVPAAMHGADQLPGLRPGTGLTAVTWLMRVGFFGAPLLVGLIADATSLRVGLLVGAGRGPGRDGCWRWRSVRGACHLDRQHAGHDQRDAEPINQVSGSSNRNLAMTATSATPHAVHTP